MSLRPITILTLLSAVLPMIAAVSGGAPPEDDWPDWALEEDRIRDRIAAVNEGELNFVSGNEAERAHLHHNRLVISERSLVDGWVSLSQCHTRLDQVAAAQIVFRPERARHLRVTSASNIKTAYTHGSTVQLRGIGADSRLCLCVETRALTVLEDGVYELNNGPFMRRFLDGYYPMTVRLEIAYPKRLALAGFSPEVQPGFDVERGPGQVTATAVFEGSLRTRFLFLAD